MKSRKEEVRNSFLYAWNGYMKHAFPEDELLPVTGRAKNNFNGWSVTVVDSLSTMWLMGLKKEFYEGVQAIERQTFTKSTNYYIPFFETVIRHLGGYLSAYALSKEPILLSLANDLGTMLIPAFNTNSSLPGAKVRPVTGEVSLGSGLLAEIGSCQLEYKYLAKMTGRPEFYERPDYVMTHLYKAPTLLNGLFAEHWSISTGAPHGGKYTVGANTDSTYEYFLKQYLLAGDKRALAQYLISIEAIISDLLFVSPSRELLYVTDISTWWKDDRPPKASHVHEHLACYLPGVLALGAHMLPQRLAQEPDLTVEFITNTTDPDAQKRPRVTLEYSEGSREKHMWAAEGLAYTCWALYADQASGLSSDGTQFVSSGKKWDYVMRAWEQEGKEGKPPGTREPPVEKDASKRDYSNSMNNDRYLMRPETVESIYLLWKTTGNPIWRERGYEIYKAIEKHTKTPYGYASVKGVDSVPPRFENEMPSYFLAETLKYLYLLFDDEDPIDLDKWVFNTEAHPLPVFTWNEMERTRFNVIS